MFDFLFKHHASGEVNMKREELKYGLRKTMIECLTTNPTLKIQDIFETAEDAARYMLKKADK